MLSMEHILEIGTPLKIKKDRTARTSIYHNNEDTGFQ